MGAKIPAIVLGIALTFILTFLALGAQGAPSAPTVGISATPTPGAAQTLQVTMTFQFYSFQVPNTIFLPGSQMSYAVWENKALLSGNQTIGPNLIAQSGFVYTESATFNVYTVALCTNPCSTTVENITVVASASVHTYPTIWFSTTTTTTFSNVYPKCTGTPICMPPPTGQQTGGVGAPNPNGFYLEFFGFIFAAIAVSGFSAYAAMPGRSFLIVGTVSVALTVVVVILF